MTKIIAHQSLFPLLLHPTQAIMNGNRTIRREKVNMPLSWLEESHLVTSHDKRQIHLTTMYTELSPSGQETGAWP